ncbi:MAG: CRISPR-associated helicase Cas3' [Bifidobacteriaceae bacterium]|jgi:CRISPR-associated endonuclease/helicase Cas3|nr:CRISPR-associated helicase Cas3' [Bifidobacteriaceae bacterium]
MGNEIGAGSVVDGLSGPALRRIGALWGKQREGFALLLGHMLDAAAVGEVMWDKYFSPALRSRLDAAAGGNGRRFFAFACGIHDVGKCTPSFQRQVGDLWAAVCATGLGQSPLLGNNAARHADAGGRIAHDLLAKAGWAGKAADWVWPLVAGHHGVIRRGSEIYGRLGGIRPEALGWSHTGWQDPGWEEIQDLLLKVVARAAGFDNLAAAAPVGTPARGTQLVVAGLVIMADWIASSGACRDKAHCVGQLGMDKSRERAEAAWGELELRGGWDLAMPRPGDLMAERFGRAARPVQALAQKAAGELPGPGLLIIEAPMGEGKTEAALAAAEILAHRFGLDGLFVGMPTQATSDPMWERVLNWTAQVAAGVPVALSHGKARFNPRWRALAKLDFGETEIYDEDPPAPGATGQGGGGPAEVARWFTGRERPLLTPVCVGTVDNLLLAATRTKRVALRFAGLGGKVVLLDEVHSYSVYTHQFLRESLRWLGSAGCPVVALTATLPPALRCGLVAAYLEGAASRAGDAPAISGTRTGYPLITWACAVDGRPVLGEAVAQSGLPSRRVAVEVLEDTPGRRERFSGDQADIRDRIAPVVEAGGRVLVVCNTVSRAQAAYLALRQRFGDAVELLHARLTAGDRAERAEKLLARLGPNASNDVSPRVVVGTQVLEQSLDLDADLVVTDLAPMDALLQRIGRAHRHSARDPYRPASAKSPRVLITGVRWSETGPLAPPGVGLIYSPVILMRTAALVLSGAAAGWELPRQIPSLVAEAYREEDEELIPQPWRASYEAARVAQAQDQRQSEQRAQRCVLGGSDSFDKPTLAGLHAWQLGTLADDDEVAAVVRDGPETVEVMLIKKRGGNRYTLGGRKLTTGDVPVDDDERAVAEASASLVRLPPIPELTKEAKRLGPLAAFGSDPHLSGLRVLELDADARGEMAGHSLSYDPELGLVTTRLGAGR